LRANFPSSPVIEAKIEDVTSSELLRIAGLNVGELDLLAGGPPCPPYSKSRFYRKEKPRALDDPAAQTLSAYLRVLEDTRPKAFLIENVPGLLYKVHSEAFNLVIAAAERLGYDIAWKIVNAADFGVPQIRERLFIVGTRNGHKYVFPHPTHERIERAESFFRSQPWVTTGAAIGDLDTSETASDEGHRAGGRHHDLLREVPPGDNYLFFTKKRGYPTPMFKWRSRYWSFLLKLSPDMPSWTIQARRSNNMGPFHWRNRILRIEEIKRLQTFPDDFDVVGKVDSAWRQIGNAVPPLLARRLGEALFAALDVPAHLAEASA
jgi:DNA (cytosine-5)-methyltransferase 1